MKIEKTSAETIAKTLQHVCEELSTAARTAAQELPAERASELNRKIAEAMTIVGWDILECMIYARFPELRPYTAPYEKSDGKL